jgi:hypothetical protein
MKLRRMKWVGHVACMGIRELHQRFGREVFLQLLARSRLGWKSIQDRECVCNRTLRCVCATIVAVKTNKYYIF